MGRQLYAEILAIKQRLDGHEARISATEEGLRELNRDIALLGDIVMRSKRRARSRLAKRRSKP